MADTRYRLPRLAIVFTPNQKPEELPPLARAAEQAGLDDLWIWEDCFAHGGMTTAAAALATTERIPATVGLLPAPLRNVALTAMEIAGLHRMFPGRFSAGIGHGVQSWMTQAGAGVQSPMTLLTEYLTCLRRLLDGDTVTFDGRYVQLDHVRLAWPPTTPVTIPVGGKGPKTLAYSARHGDGTLLATALTVDEVRSRCELIHRTRANTPGQHPIAAALITATGPGCEHRLATERARWGRPGTTVGVAGTADRIATEVLALAAAGATTVAIVPTADEPDLTNLVEFVGTQVRQQLIERG